jgi:hypothetical protein
VCELCHDGFPNHNLLKLHRRTAHTSTPSLPARGANRKRKSLLLKEEKTVPGVEQDIVVQTTSSELETGRQGEENQTPSHRWVLKAIDLFPSFAGFKKGNQNFFFIAIALANFQKQYCGSGLVFKMILFRIPQI